MTLKKLINTKAEVKEILERYEITRDDDNILYFILIKLLCERYGINFKTLTAEKLLLSSNFPTMESVGRTRRKIQAQMPELAPSEEAKKRKKHNEAIYREFAHENESLSTSRILQKA